MAQIRTARMGQITCTGAFDVWQLLDFRKQLSNAVSGSFFFVQAIFGVNFLAEEFWHLFINRKSLDIEKNDYQKKFKCLSSENIWSEGIIEILDIRVFEAFWFYAKCGGSIQSQYQYLWGPALSKIFGMCRRSFTVLAKFFASQYRISSLGETL